MVERETGEEEMEAAMAMAVGQEGREMGAAKRTRAC